MRMSRLRALAAIVLGLGLSHPFAFANEAESWYFTFGLGYAPLSHAGSFSGSAEEVRSSADSRTPVSAQLGFYWPLKGDRTMVGISSYAVVEQFRGAKASGEAASLQIGQCLTGFSAQ